MSIFIPTNTGTRKESAQQTEFRRQLDAIPSWPARAQKIEDRLQETTRALAARNEQLYALRGGFRCSCHGLLERIRSKARLRKSL
jgi:hypothetical protein